MPELFEREKIGQSSDDHRKEVQHVMWVNAQWLHQTGLFMYVMCTSSCGFSAEVQSQLMAYITKVNP